MRKQLTPEQVAARDERRRKFRELWKTVAAMPTEKRLELSAQYGFRTCEGHELSLSNQMLIALQKPAASVLGGFRQWIDHGRAVRKGEHGAMIWVPIGKGKAATSENPEPTANAEAEETRFMIGTLFDISQTDEVQTANA